MADSYDLTIILNGVDITTNCPFDKLDHDDNLRSPSYFGLTYENATFAPEQGMQLLVIAKSMPDARAIFNGFVLELTERKRDNAISLEYELDCGDIKAILAKAVLPYAEYTGTDAEIISGLFANAYPDLSSLVDFETGIDSFGDDLAFTSNEESLLDALNRFADSTGANMRFDTRTGASDILIRFTPESDVLEYQPGGTAGATPYWYHDITPSDWSNSLPSSGGNPGYCVKYNQSYSPSTHERASFIINVASAGVDITNVSFDVKVVGGTASDRWSVRVDSPDGAGTILASTDGLLTIDAWTHIDCVALSGSFPLTPIDAGNGEYRLRISVGYHSLTAASGLEIYIDNIAVEATVALQEEGKDKLVYSAVPEAADFDFDIDTSTEFGADFNLNLGALDDFNSVTVVGGKEKIPIEWIYEHDGSNERLQLEAPILSIECRINVGSDLVPDWLEMGLGIFGKDLLLTDEGGDEDVLYDPDNHWLLFDSISTPNNLKKSVKVTGFIQKPIRVRVENIGDGDMTFATVVNNENITTEEEAIAFGNSILAKKNAPRRLEFITYNEGLKVGQELTVNDSNRGLNEVLIIRRISTKWIGTSTAQFSVECGSDDASSIDNIIVGIDKKASKNVPNGDFTTTTIQKLLDTDNEQLIDTLGGVLYEVA